MNPEDTLLWNRAFEKFDQMEEKINKLCTNMTNAQAQLDSHLQEQENKAKRKEKIFYAVIAGMATIFSIISFAREQV